MQLKSANRDELWTDYTVTNRASGKSYRVALRGWERGDSYCSCPDFRKNTLGTCKHILYALEQSKKRFDQKARNTPYHVRDMAVHLRYGKETELRLLAPDQVNGKLRSLIRPFMNRAIGEVSGLLSCIKELERLGLEVTIYPDARRVHEPAPLSRPDRASNRRDS